MKIDVLTLFPEMFKGPFGESMVKRAQDKGKVEIKIHNLRDWTEDKHKTVDLPPYGGGPGMVMKVDVVDRAVEELRRTSLQSAEGSELSSATLRTAESSEPPSADRKVVLLDTKGAVYNQRKAVEFSKLDHLILIAGHYEGVDHRAHKYIADEVVSIGEYVLTGGEIPAMVVVDSVVRLLPGVLGNPESLEGESYSMTGEKPLNRQYPQYTRPEEYKGWKVPKVLLSGDHKKIKEWRNS